MVDLTDKRDETRGVFEEIATKESAIAYINDLIDQIEVARAVTVELDQRVNLLVMGPGLDVGLAHGLRKAREKSRDSLMIRYGRAIGALATLMHCRKLTAEDYNQLAGRAHKSLIPRTVEAIGG